MSSLLQEINSEAKKKGNLTEAMGCENEEHVPKKRTQKPKVPDIVKCLQKKFTDPSKITIQKVKNAIKAEFKKELYSLEKEEWEKMSKEDQEKFADAVFTKLKE